MAFDWLNFLGTRGIEFVERGPNVSRGNVNISCPFCGTGDESHHLGISLKGKGWGCWRSRLHRGRRPHRLVQALIGCSYIEAARIVGDEQDIALSGEGNFANEIEQMMTPGAWEEDKLSDLDWLDTLYPIEAKRHYVAPARSYLEYRGYHGDEVYELCKLYDLRYAISGPFKMRVCIPVVMEQGLVNWTGRDITGSAMVRYKTLTTDVEKAEAANLPLAPLSIDKTLWNYAELLDCDAKTLVVVEGPFDALNIDWRGARHGIRATCLFGKNLSDAQVELLDAIAHRFKRRIVLLDPDASMDSISMQSRLEYLRFKFAVTPRSVEDPAEMSTRQVRALSS